MRTQRRSLWTPDSPTEVGSPTEAGPLTDTRLPAKLVGGAATSDNAKQNLQAIQTPMMWFTPYAWAKLVYMRDIGDSEVSGYGICRPDLDQDLLVEDFMLVPQKSSNTLTEFDDAGIGEFYDRMVALDMQPNEFGRIWIHTHPGNMGTPSGTDEDTFREKFGDCDWSIMYILAKLGAQYCRMQFNAGPGGVLFPKTAVDFQNEFRGSCWADWDREYYLNVTLNRYTSRRTSYRTPYGQDYAYGLEDDPPVGPTHGLSDKKALGGFADQDKTKQDKKNKKGKGKKGKGRGKGKKKPKTSEGEDVIILDPPPASPTPVSDPDDFDDTGAYGEDLTLVETEDEATQDLVVGAEVAVAGFAQPQIRDPDTIQTLTDLGFTVTQIARMSLTTAVQIIDRGIDPSEISVLPDGSLNFIRGGFTKV